MLSTEDVVYIQNTNRLKIKEWKKDISWKKQPLLISDKTDFKTTKMWLETKRNILMIKLSTTVRYKINYKYVCA